MTQDTTNDSTPAARTPRRPALRRGIVAAALLVGGFAVGAGTFAAASTGGMPWHGGFHHGHGVGFIQHVTHEALENAGATNAQEDKIHDIIAKTYLAVDKTGEDRDALRKQMLDLMKAPTVDKAAIEALRAKTIATLDARSKTIVDALVEAAADLSPEQRAKLVEHAEHMGPRGGWRHGMMDRRDGGPGATEGHGPGEGHGPADHG